MISILFKKLSEAESKHSGLIPQTSLQDLQVK